MRALVAIALSARNPLYRIIISSIILPVTGPDYMFTSKGNGFNSSVYRSFSIRKLQADIEVAEILSS